MSGPSWHLSGDFRTATLTFPDELPAKLELGADELQRFVLYVGMLRSRMSPPVSDTLPDVADVPVNDGPAWGVDADPAAGKIRLLIRDPSFGWLRIEIPLADADSLAKHILARVVALQPKTE